MPSNPLKRYQHGEGSYALVTGATLGMGEEWAHQLAALGFNLIIHGRSQAKLDAVRAAILAKHATVDVKTAIADAGALPPNLGELEALLPALSQSSSSSSSSSSSPSPGKEARITVLINNIGVTSKAFPLFEEAPTEDLLQQIAINDVFPTILTQRVLPTLKRNQPSLIVNVTSMGAWAPSPYLSAYSGSKAYNLIFSRSLYNEMRCEGNQVDVTTLVPGQVVSGMNEGPPTANMPTSHDFIRTTISKLSGGLFGVRPPPIMVPWMAHSMGYLAMQLMPRAMADWAVRSTVVDLRKKKLAAEQREKPSEDQVVPTMTANSSAGATANGVHEDGKATMTN